MRVIKNYLFNVLYQVFLLIVPLMTTPYLARTLGPTGVGINSYTNSIIQYFILFGSVGVSFYGNRQVAFNRDNVNQLSKTFYEIFFLRCITICIAYFAFIIFLVFTTKYYWYFVAQSISIVAAAFDISWFFMGIEDFAVTVLRNFIVKLVTLISIFTLVKNFHDLTMYIMILSISTLLGNFTLFPSLKKYIKAPNLSNINLIQHLKPSIALFIPQIAIQIYLVLDKTMLGSMDSVTSAGFFDSSDKIIKMVLAIATSTGTVMLPHVANAFIKGKKEKIKSYLYTSFSFVSAISIPMMFGLSVLSSKFVPLFFTSKFSSVIPIMEIESAVILFIAWGSALGEQFLLPTNQIKSYTTSVVLGALINLIANIPLIIFWGAVGTAVATVLSELVVSFYQLFSIRKQISYRLLFKDFYKYLFSGIIMFFVLKLIDIYTPHTWFMLFMEVIIGMIVYFVFLIMFHAGLINQGIAVLRKHQ